MKSLVEFYFSFHFINCYLKCILKSMKIIMIASFIYRYTKCIRSIKNKWLGVWICYGNCPSHWLSKTATQRHWECEKRKIVNKLLFFWSKTRNTHKKVCVCSCMCVKKGLMRPIIKIQMPIKKLMISIDGDFIILSSWKMSSLLTEYIYILNHIDFFLVRASFLFFISYLFSFLCLSNNFPF